MEDDLIEALAELERVYQRSDYEADLEQRYGFDPDLAARIAQIASSLDQAHAIAELMQSPPSDGISPPETRCLASARRPTAMISWMLALPVVVLRLCAAGKVGAPSFATRPHAG
jgi:hypothetical protein